MLKLPKKILGDEGLLSSIIITQKYPFNVRFELVSDEDDEFTFLWEIQQSTKSSIRISFHHQENESKTGLLRVDFNSGHKNPEEVSSSLPAKFHPFVGKHFSNQEHHIHYHVQGYKSLAWAVPLSHDTFEVKEIRDDANFNDTFAQIIETFARTVNIVTKIQVNTFLL